jgi:hypothetical protein
MTPKISERNYIHMYNKYLFRKYYRKMHIKNKIINNLKYLSILSVQHTFDFPNFVISSSNVMDIFENV